MPQREIPRLVTRRTPGNRLFKLPPRRFYHKRGEWKHTSERQRQEDEGLPSKFRLLTWNVDFNSNWPNERLNAVLKHIQYDIFRCDEGQEPDPCCILLQEVHARSLSVILENEWIREYFVATPTSKPEFAEMWVHGNVTLVSRQIPVVNAAMLEFSELSDMGRSATIVELRLATDSVDEDGVEHTTMLRVINVHLESLEQGFVNRQRQLALLKSYLERFEQMGTIVAGDMNSVSQYDNEVIEACGLEDAWTGRAGKDEITSATWGFQSGQTKYPPSRLDKILFVRPQPESWFTVTEPKKRGLGVKCVTKDGERYASDHCALMSTVRIHCLPDEV